MNCFNHNDVNAIGICIKCGKCVCSSCASTDSDGKILCTSCATSKENPDVERIDPLKIEIIEPQKNSTHSSKSNDFIASIILLLIALSIDFFDFIPWELLGIGFIFELPLSAIESLFLIFVGTPPIKSIGEGAADLVPIVDFMPWCTLAILDKRYNLKIPGLTWFFNKY